MKEHHLKALVQVAESGSIRGAARAINLSQSALTKALRELEQDVGAELLRRSYKGIEFTEAGATLLHRARLALSILDKAKEEIARTHGGCIVRLAIGITPLVSALELPQVLKEFDRLHPAAEITLTEGLLTTVLPDLIEGRLDFALAIANPEDLPYEVEFQSMCQVRPAIAGRTGHPLAAARTWEELEGAKWALNLGAGSHSGHLLDWMKQQGYGEPRNTIRCASALLMVELMRRTDRLSMGPARLFQDPLFRHGIQCLDVSPMPPPMSIGLLTVRGLPLCGPAKQLATLFERHLAFLDRLEKQEAPKGASASPDTAAPRI